MHGKNVNLPEDSNTLQGFAVINEIHRAYPKKGQKWPWVVVVVLLLFLVFLFLGPPLIGHIFYPEKMAKWEAQDQAARQRVSQQLPKE